MTSPLKAAALAACLLPAPAALALDLDAMTDAERDAFGTAVRSYLLDNPEVIMEAIDALRAREAAQQAADDLALVQTNADALFDDGFSWVGGNPEGDITLVEFVDYRCGYCRKAHGEVEDLIAQDGNIRFIIKEFPILGQNSVLSARFAIATKLVAGDEAYKAAHDTLIAFNGEVNRTSLDRMAVGLGLDADAILEKMDSDAVTEQIQATQSLAARLKITGTPTFVMQDELLRGYLPLEDMQQLVALKRD